MKLRLVLSVLVVFCLLALRPALARIWTDSTGAHEIEAELVKLDGEVVHLKKPDGAVVKIPLNKLCLGDRRFIQQQMVAKAPAAGPKIAAPRPPKAGLPDAAKVRDAAAPVSPAAALSSPTRAQFVGTPLKDVVDFLKDFHHIEIQVDHKALKEAGVSPETPVTVATGRRETLQSALDKILRPLQLEWVVLNEVILVTTLAKADSDPYMETRIYKILQRTDTTMLIDKITSEVAPKTWTEAGGCGTLAAWPTNAVVISQSQRIHRLLENHFAGLLRRADPGAARPNRRKADNGPAVKLDRQVSLEFVETPLKDVVAYLCDVTKLQIQLDEKALKEMGVAADVPITINLRHVSLRTALTMLNIEYDLAWAATAKGIEITSPTVAEEKLTVVSYDVRDIVAVTRDTKPLVELITNSAEPKTWQENGGVGTVHVGRGGTVLEVRQNDRAHEQIEQLLAAVRAAARP